MEADEREKVRAHEIAKLKIENKQTGTGTSNAKAPKLPSFIDGKDELDAYLLMFERFAEARGWNKEDWAINLSALLTGEALTVYGRLSVAESLDYDKVKIALLKRYQLSEEGFRKKFRASKAEKGENPSQFITRMGSYLDRWVEMSQVEQTFEGLRTLILKEQFIGSCAKDVAVYLQEKVFSNLDDMAEEAERFLNAHGKELSDTGLKGNKTAYRDDENPAATGKQTKQCFNCKREGHVKAECRDKGGDKEVRCTLCSRYGHEATYCRAKKKDTGVSAVVDVNVVGEDDSPDSKLKVIRTRLGGQVVSTLRDNGCTAICVNSKLVKPEQLTVSMLR